jgi:hypothetical protein
LRADIHVAPRSNSVYPDAAHVGGIAKRDTANGRGKDQRARPSAKRRRAMRRAAAAADEEDMMNG